MAADLTIVTKRVIEALGAALPRTFTATVAQNNLNRNTTAISEAIREAALMIGRAILANKDHIHRNLFISGTPTSLTHAGELPDMAGEGDLVEIQPYSGATFITGQIRDVQQIDAYRTNTSSLYSTLSHTTQFSPLSGFYAMSKGRIYFTGNAAQGYFPIISRSTITSLIPDEYEGTWFMLGLGACLKEGDNLLPLGSFYMNIGLQDLSAISVMGVMQKVPAMAKAQEMRGNA